MGTIWDTTLGMLKATTLVRDYSNHMILDAPLYTASHLSLKMHQAFQLLEIAYNICNSSLNASSGHHEPQLCPHCDTPTKCSQFKENNHLREYFSMISTFTRLKTGNSIGHHPI